jgi:subtilisin family serine protease
VDADKAAEFRKALLERREPVHFLKKSVLYGAILSATIGVISLTAFAFVPPGGVDGTLNPAKPLFRNWGLTNDQSNSHISILDAWKIEEGSRNVVVAVIDTGLDADHPDLKGNVWTDPAAPKTVLDPLKKFPERTKPTYGWNFVSNEANPRDDHGHGTHVAGIIGAIANPKAGIAGVAKRVSIMSVKYYSDANPGPVNLRNTVRAINYAVDHGAKIINYSGGGPEFSKDEFEAIKRAESKGVLFVAAAGNEQQDTDKAENAYYPSAYRLSNILSVAATDINNKLLKSSNWGKSKVDVAAPGENIYSTLPNGRYGYMTGTSQATAFVSGMAALLLSKDPYLTPVQLKELIKKSVDRIPQLEEKLATGGRVNAYKALVALRDQIEQSQPKVAPKTTPVLAQRSKASATSKSVRR